MDSQGEEALSQRQDPVRAAPQAAIWLRGVLALLGLVCVVAILIVVVLLATRRAATIPAAINAYLVMALCGLFLLLIGLPSFMIYRLLRRDARRAAWVAMAHDALVVLLALLFVAWSIVGVSQGQFESLGWDIAAVICAVPFAVEGVVLWRWGRGSRPA